MLILKAPKQTHHSPTGPSPLFWYLRSPRTYTTMATTIAETSEDDTQAYSNKANTDMCETKQNQLYSTIKKKNNTTSASDSRPSLKFSAPLESCSDIYAGPTSCLIITLLVNVLLLQYFPLFYLTSLSIYSRSANIHPVHSKWALLYQY